MGLSANLQLAFVLAAASIFIPALQPLSGPEFRIYEGHLQDGERRTEKPEGLPSGFSSRAKFLEFFQENLLEVEFLKDPQIAPQDHHTNIEGVHHGAEVAWGGVSIPINVPDGYTFQ